MASSKLLKLLKVLETKKAKKANYVVPDVFDVWNYQGEKKCLPTGEVLVNPYDFYRTLITDYILPNKKDEIDYGKSISRINKAKQSKNYSGGDWIKKSVVYSMIVRASSSWDSDRSYSLDDNNFDGLNETGTFVKTLALLPFLQQLGVNTLYLLPISKFSIKDKKGELGSPYGVSSYFDLDPNLKDKITGYKMTVDDEFKALVEACHILGIRVMIDIIPRTNAVCNDLIKDHPDWFYWIKASKFGEYKVPTVPGLEPTTPPVFKYMKDVYDSEDVLRHINMFEFDPKTQNKELFEQIKTDDTLELIQRIEDKFDLKIAPAFSDNINDPQPPWTDATFFRMYLDHPTDTSVYLKDKNTAPYILFDSIKANLYPGEQPNMELWNTLSDVLPYYQKKYGIDGTRIDMGHALPKDLLDLIFKKAKDVDKDFCFIAEELNMDNDKKAKELGYNMIIGNGFWMEPRAKDGKFKDFVNQAYKVALPLFACAETHDTPRIAARSGERTLAKLAFILNMFIPNTVPFINSGQEVYEVQPMNLGIDASNNDLFMLPENDPYYGKLALFDRFAFHYLNHNHFEIRNHLTDVLRIRNEWLDTMVNLNNYLPIYFYERDTLAVGIGYVNPKTHKCLLVLANTDCFNGREVHADLSFIREKAKNNNFAARLHYATYEFPRDFYEFSESGDLYCYLGAGEVKIIEL